MNLLLLIAIIFPIAIGGMLRRMPMAAARRLAAWALVPLVILAIGIYLHRAPPTLMPQWRLFSLLVALFSAGFAYRWLQQAVAWPFVHASLILLLGFVVLLILNVSHPPSLVLLANLPALLLHALPPTAVGNTSKSSDGIIRRWLPPSLSPVAPAAILATGSVLAAFFIPATSPDALSPVSSVALGVVVALLIWQLLLHLISGQPNHDVPGGQHPGTSVNPFWLMQRQVRVASVAAILLVLLHLRPLITHSPFTLSVVTILSGAMLVVVGSLLLMERDVPAILSLMEYIWIGSFLAGLDTRHWPLVGMLRHNVSWILVFMTADCWLSSDLLASPSRRLNLDTIIGWRFSRKWNAAGLLLLVLAMQFLPVMPACRFLIVLLSGLATVHPIIAILVLTANGVMLVTAFRVLGAMYLRPGHRTNGQCGRGGNVGTEGPR